MNTLFQPLLDWFHRRSAEKRARLNADLGWSILGLAREVYWELSPSSKKHRPFDASKEDVYRLFHTHFLDRPSDTTDTFNPSLMGAFFYPQKQDMASSNRAFDGEVPFDFSRPHAHEWVCHFFNRLRQEAQERFEQYLEDIALQAAFGVLNHAEWSLNTHGFSSRNGPCAWESQRVHEVEHTVNHFSKLPERRLQEAWLRALSDFAQKQQALLLQSTSPAEVCTFLQQAEKTLSPLVQKFSQPLTWLTRFQAFRIEVEYELLMRRTQQPEGARPLVLEAL